MRGARNWILEESIVHAASVDHVDCASMISMMLPVVAAKVAVFGLPGQPRVYLGEGGETPHARQPSQVEIPALTALLEATTRLRQTACKRCAGRGRAVQGTRNA